jgi:quercetin dioxygenase-like cupin family protein
MKTIFKTVVLYMGIYLLVTGCDNSKKQQTMKEQANTAIFSRGDKAPSDYFTGEAFIHPLVAKDKNNDFALGSVTFEAGARTVWHTHPRGQVLLVTEGEGIYQERGKPARHLRKGDIVNIPENVEHWHGATDNAGFVHLAITNYKGDQNVIWLKPVTNDEYRAANRQ